MKCLKCGKEMIEENTICDECIEEVADKEKIEEENEGNKKKNNKFLKIVKILFVIGVIILLIVLMCYVNYMNKKPRLIGHEKEIYNFEEDLDGDNITETIKIEQKKETYDYFSIIDRKKIDSGELVYDGNDRYTTSNFKVYINDILIDEFENLIDVIDIGVYKINNKKGITFWMHRGWSITNPSTEIELYILEDNKFKKTTYSIDEHWTDTVYKSFKWKNGDVSINIENGTYELISN